jgi:hypothetical protein
MELFLFSPFSSFGKTFWECGVTFYLGRFAQGSSTKLTFGQENQERLG